MRVFEILIAESAVSREGGPFVVDEKVVFWLPDEAEEILEPILAPYGQNPGWFFDKINFGPRPAPWALVCLDREYDIAGHVATSRLPNAGIGFSPYNQVPKDQPDDFVPGVGVVTFESRPGLECSVGNSPVFEAAWGALRERSLERRWLVILDPLSPEWLDQVLPGDRERWLSFRRQ